MKPSPPSPAAARYATPALEKGLDILELLAAEESGVTQRQIADALGRSTSEIFRMLTCLEQRGFIRRARPEDLYYLTPKLFVLAHHYPPTRRLHDAALPILRSLASQTSQACHLAILHDGQALIIAQADAPGFMGFVVRPGTRMALNLTSSGATLVAFQNTIVGQQSLKDAGLTAAECRAMESRLARIRHRGYEQQPSQSVRGITDLSVPVLDHNGHAAAAMTVPYLTKVQNSLTIAAVRQHMLAAAETLSRNLGAGA